MTKEQLIDRHAQALKSWVGTGLAKDECIGLIKNAVDEALFLYGVVNCKITALVTYYTWEDAPHYMLDDTKNITTKIVEVEKLADINEMFTNLIDVKVLK
jgi:hypothetical protein